VVRARVPESALGQAPERALALAPEQALAAERARATGVVDPGMFTVKGREWKREETDELR